MRTRCLSLLACAVLGTLTVACKRQGSESSASAGNADASPAEGACRLLRDGEVSSIFAGSGRGEVDDSRKEYGISACEWKTAQGRFVAQLWKAENASAKDEAQGLALGVIDPLKGDARNALRYED